MLPIDKAIAVNNINMDIKIDKERFDLIIETLLDIWKNNILVVNNTIDNPIQFEYKSSGNHTRSLWNIDELFLSSLIILFINKN